MKPLKNLPGIPALLGPKSLRHTNPSVLETIQTALANRKPLTAIYNKKHREFSPIALGMRDGEHRLWLYQFGGESSHICKCFVVAEMSAVDIAPGEWLPPRTDPGLSDCMTMILQRMGELPVPVTEPTP